MRRILFVFFSLVCLNTHAQCSFQLFSDFQSETPYIFDCVGMQAMLNLDITSGTFPYQVSLLQNGQEIFNDELTPINELQYPNIVTLPIAIGAGIFSFNVTDSLGNSCTNTFEIQEPTPIEINAVTTPPISCLEGNLSISISGGSPPYDVGYLQNGVLVPNFAENINGNIQISDLPSGNYVVTVEDDLGCLQSIGNTTPISLVQTIFEPVISIDFVSQLLVCVSGGQIPFQFNLSNEESIISSLDTVANCVGFQLCEGAYVINVIDDFGCEVSIQQSIPSLEVELSAETSSASITGGITPYQEIAWSLDGIVFPFETQEELSVSMCPGSYNCTVTDQIGCVQSETLLIEELTTDWLEEIDCSNLEFSELSINPQGGTPPYSVVWNTGETSMSISDLSPQLYQATIADANDCESNLYSIDLPMLTSDCLFNVFSPTIQDNINDTWNINPAFLFENSRVTIYNRLGKRMFDSYGYQTPWDGTNQSGDLLNQGVFFYVIHLKDGEEPLKGTVTLF